MTLAYGILGRNVYDYKDKDGNGSAEELVKEYKKQK